MPRGDRRLFRARGGILPLAVCAALSVRAASASTDASVLVLAVTDDPARPGLADELRIQLRGVASVDPAVRTIRRAPLSTMLTEAAAQARAAGSAYAIWAEGGAEGDHIEVVLYIASDRPGRALVEVVRVKAGTDTPDVDRALAVKVREVIHAAQAAPRPDISAALAPSPPPVDQPPAEEEPGLSAAPLVAVGAGRAQVPARVADTSGLVLAGARLDLVALPLSLEARAQLRFGGTLAAASDAGEVEVSESSLALQAVGLWRLGRWRAGGGLAAGARRLAAEGTTAGGARGERVRWLPAISLGPEVRVGLGAGLELGAGLALDLAGRHQRFALNDMVVLDVGRARLIADLFLLISTR